MVHAILAAFQWIDVQAYYLISRLHGNWLLDRLASLLEGNLLLKSGPILCVLWYFWFLDDEKQEDRRSLIIAILAGTFFGLLVSRSLAVLLPYRPRPIYDTQLVVHPLSFDAPTSLLGWSSFPSDHAAYFAAIGVGVIYLCRKLAIPALLYLAFWICLPRLYLGFHYLSDIVAGVTIGILACIGCIQAPWIRTKISPRVLSVTQSKPQVFYPLAFVLMFEIGSMFMSTREALLSFLHFSSFLRHGLRL